MAVVVVGVSVVAVVAVAFAAKTGLSFLSHRRR